MANNNSNQKDKETREIIYKLLEVQSNSIKSLQNQKSAKEIRAVSEAILDSDDDVIISGVGKSGDVSRKIDSIFNSIGIKSKHIHPVDALHGDLGAISNRDVILLLSNSGNTDEMVDLLNALTRIEPTTVSITSNPDSELGGRTDYHINTKIEEEGAVVELVPMASATITMVIGDCIANALMADRDFSKQEYGHFHPGGTIGKRLLLTVEDLLHEDIPKTRPADTLAQVALKISKGGKGIAVVQDDEDNVKGILTDGDIRRLIESGIDFHNVVGGEVMITDPITTSVDMSVISALEVLEENNISQLVATDQYDRFLGVVHIHDIMEKGLTT
jgi:arabinose-5-phosphate isomerase